MQMIPLTSREALVSLDVDAQREKVLAIVRSNASRESLALTAAELASNCDTLDSYAFNRRLPELREKGKVKCSGTRKNGRKCFIKKSQCMTWWAV